MNEQDITNAVRTVLDQMKEKAPRQKENMSVNVKSVR